MDGLGHFLERSRPHLHIFLLFNFLLIADFFAFDLVVDFLDRIGQFFLIVSHLFTLFDAFFVIIEHVSDRHGANHIEQQEVDKSSHCHHLEGAIRGREHRKDALNTSVRLLTLLDKGGNVLNQLHLVNAEHDTQAHGHSDAGLLLLVCKNGLSEREQHVENDCEAETPVDFDVGVVGQVDRQVVPSVLVAAAGPLETLLRCDNFVESGLVLRRIERVVLLLNFVKSDINLII